MNKLAKLIQQLGANELTLIQKDLETGTLQRLVEEEIQRHRRGPNKTCPVCGASIQAHNALKLEFGPAELRQQAHFDATDCLEHFVAHTLKNKSVQQQYT